jgi:fermentation-respiration switch protein FrsA (DUF1100 family)
MPIEKRDVMFKSGETFSAAWFFVPEQVRSSGRVPAVAMAHGIGAVKEMSLEQFARRFAAAGIAALVFDYRGLGGSGGEPRQRIFPHDQMEDYRNALTWLSLQPEIDADRLGVWGTSFSGGHVIQVAAHDPRVKAVVSQVGAMDLDQITRRVMGPQQFAGLQQLAVQERIRHAVEGGERYIPSTGRPGEGFALQSDQDSYDFAHSAGAPRNEVSMSSLEAILEHAPGRFIDLVAPRPLLMILARNDVISLPETIRNAFAGAGEPKRLLEIEGGHYAVYSGRGAEEAGQAATEWFTEHLKVRAAAPDKSSRTMVAT